MATTSDVPVINLKMKNLLYDSLCPNVIFMLILTKNFKDVFLSKIYEPQCSRIVRVSKIPLIPEKGCFLYKLKRKRKSSL